MKRSLATIETRPGTSGPIGVRLRKKLRESDFVDPGSLD
jgi:hypothetical protein